MLTIIWKIRVGAKASINTLRVASSLPITMAVTEMGAVSSTWSTFWRLSSLSIFIVRMGRAKTTTLEIEVIMY